MIILTKDILLKTHLLALLISTTLSFSATAANTYTVDPKHTFPGFEINHLGFSIQRGRFNKTSGKITLNPELSAGNIDITIETASIDTGFAELEKYLRGQDFLDAKRYPKITFLANRLSFDKNQLIAADGLLTLHGIAKPVHLKIDHFYCGMNLITLKNTCGANITSTLKRSDFGIDKYAPKLADEVSIVIPIEATKD
jgi:polyisoprenoid-binding protein YceI